MQSGKIDRRMAGDGVIRVAPTGSKASPMSAMPSWRPNLCVATNRRDVPAEELMHRGKRDAQVAMLLNHLVGAGEQIDASFKNGILNMTLPKSPTARQKVRRIAINGK